MVGSIRVLLTDEKDEVTSQLANALRANRMEVRLCQKNGVELLNLIEETKPDVVIMDATWNEDVLIASEKLSNEL